MGNLNVCSLVMIFLLFKVTYIVKGGEVKILSVVVKGTVVCKACFDVQHGLQILPAQSAVVAISCSNGKRKMKDTLVRNITNKYGDFVIHLLPSHLHGIRRLEKACVVKVLQLPRNSPCRLPMKRLKRINLTSMSSNVRTYTIGSIRLQHTSEHAPNCLKKQNDGEDITWRTQ
ncbi:hypothetical protein ACHQM5_001349 [Ranunculus cassubicifolius]